MKNKVLMFISGFALLIVGMTLLLGNWEAAAIVFKGVVPAAIAVGGLVVLFSASIKQ